MNDQCVQVLLKYKEININQQDNIIPNETSRLQNVSHKEEYQEDVIKIYFVNPTEENCNECQKI